MTNARLRFAPSPTGMMHLGNVRAALMNALFAKKLNGTFILRIEDTDQTRNFDPCATNIIKDLHWLQLFYDEGPEKGGPCAPYYQSQRTSLYQYALNTLIEKKSVYRCFCTPEELEHRRERQIALKKPPRYDRTCLELSDITIEEQLANKIPFIWRYKLNQSTTTSITDLAHKTITFDLKNFSDFPLTRSDHSFTFIFANFVDDMLMKITHVLRGEDHLTNTAYQAVLFEEFNVPKPTFWHLPMLCNIDGKKLSKRDFGFSLRDLKEDGYLPEALLNYLGIIGGGSFDQEIMSFKELATTIDFDHIKTTGQVKFDAEKLRWINNKWISHIAPQELIERCLPELMEHYPAAETMDKEKLSNILQLLKPDLATLRDVTKAMQFYFNKPILDAEVTITFADLHTLQGVIKSLVEKQYQYSQQFIDEAKMLIKQHGLKTKDLFSFIRFGITGSLQGPSLHDLLEIIGMTEGNERLAALLDL